MENQKDINESTEAPSDEKINYSSEFDHLIGSNENAEKLSKVFVHKFKQLSDRYEELSGKMNLKLTATKKTVK